MNKASENVLWKLEAEALLMDGTREWQTVGTVPGDCEDVLKDAIGHALVRGKRIRVTEMRAWDITVVQSLIELEQWMNKRENPTEGG